MKRDEDFSIQELLDQKIEGVEKEIPKTIDTDDLKAYEVVYSHLKKKPSQGLSLSFKSNVLRKIEIEKRQTNDTQFYLLLGFVLFSGIVVIASLIFIFKDSLAQSLEVLNRYKGLICIGAVAVILFNIVEKKLIKKKFNSVT